MPQEQPTTERPLNGDTPPPALSPTIVHSDLPCRDCGYNLRTLAHDHRCPECGLSVQWSAQGYQLKYARLSWLRQLRWGCDLIILHFIFSTIAFLAFIGDLDTNLYQTNVSSPWLMVCVSAVAVGVTFGIAGAWLLTMPERPNQPSRRERRYSQIVRAFLPFVGLACAVMTLDALDPPHVPTFLRDLPWHGLVPLFTLVTVIATVVLLLLHLTELVRRASNPAVRTSFVGLYYSFVLSIVALLLMVLFSSINIEWAFAVCLLLFIGFLFVHLLCYLSACVELRSELQNAIAFGVSAREQP